MPRFEYRNIQPMPPAEKAFLDWIQKLDEQFANRNVEQRCLVVRDALHELYLGRPYSDPTPDASLAEQAMLHSCDPPNASLAPEYYGHVAGQNDAKRTPL